MIQEVNTNNGNNITYHTSSTSLYNTKLMIKRDAIESVIDVGSGFFLSIIIQITIFPLFDLHPTIFENFQIALIFTVVSMTRSTLWRRFFRKRRTA